MKEVYKLLLTYFAALILIIAFSLLGIKCNAQIKPLPASSFFVAGLFEGVMDGLQFHYDKPNQFWNPDISWTNKYKNHDPQQGMTFRGRYMVFTTDGWHLMKFGRNAFTSAAIVLSIGEKKKWYRYVIDGVTYWAINRIGFNISYKLF